jgi:N-acyl-L-homoserine lactone synthetase
MKKTYEFREITDQIELESAFRLRYDVFTDCRCKSLVKENIHRLDVDMFDLHAHHYGIFHNSEMIAYIRVVESRHNYTNQTAVAVQDKYPDIFEAEGNAEFPFLSYADMPKSARIFYKKNQPQTPFFEGSRLVVTKEYRSLKLARAIAECAIVAGMHLAGTKIGLATISCCVSHERFYRLLGFQRITPDTTYSIFDEDCPCIATTLILPVTQSITSSIPAGLHPLFENLTGQYGADGRIIREI